MSSLDSIGALAKERLDYNRETGVFTWKARMAPRVPAGSVAGTTTKDGYVAIKIGVKVVLAHRLAWFFEHGEWPSGIIDHRDGVRANNQISNLRVTTHALNMQNRRAPRRGNSTGMLGVSRSVCKKKFTATIWLNGRSKHLGTFETAELASSAYWTAKQELHELCPKLA